MLETFFTRFEADEPRQKMNELFDEYMAHWTPRRMTATQIASRCVWSKPNHTRNRHLPTSGEGIPSYVRDIGIGSQLRCDWEAYVAAHEQLEEEVLGPAADKLKEALAKVQETVRTHVDQRRQITDASRRTLRGGAKVDRNPGCRGSRGGGRKGFGGARTRTWAMADVKDTVDAVRAEIQRTDLASMSPAAVERTRRKLEQKIDAVAGRYREELQSVSQQLLDVRVAREECGETPISNGEITGAIEEEVLALREAADADAELVQLGMVLRPLPMNSMR